MIIRMNRVEMAVLTLHMTIMRPNMRNGFKSKYGVERTKGILKSFDDVKTTMETEIDTLENDKTLKSLHFNVNEIKTTSSFVNWYLVKLGTTLKAAGKIDQEDQLQLDCLAGIKNRLDVLKGLHKVV